MKEAVPVDERVEMAVLVAVAEAVQEPPKVTTLVVM